MKTLRLAVACEQPAERSDAKSATVSVIESEQSLDCAAEILRNGGLVALPTETVYGLGANALDSRAVESIFAAKRRPSWDPVIVHIADLAMLDGLVEEIPEAARALMEAFWPGPLTLLLPRTDKVPDAVTSGRPLVGVRMPAHPVALELIRRAGVPVAAPSANLFGHISPTTAAHVLQDLDGRIDAVIDAGAAWCGVESTVLDPSCKPILIYRPGAVTLEEIRRVAGDAEIHVAKGPLVETDERSMTDDGRNEERAALPSPGVGLRHYAPRARLILVESEVATAEAAPSTQAIEKNLEGALAEQGELRVGVLLPEEMSLSGAAERFAWGSWREPEQLASRLYAGLRELDALGCAVILAPLPASSGMGAALRDRMLKAGHLWVSAS